MQETRVNTDELWKFILVECPDKGCLLCKDTHGRYYLIKKGINEETGKLITATINDRLWYDYGFRFTEGNPWTIIYKDIQS